MAEAANPFAQFLAPPDVPAAAAASVPEQQGANPFAAFVPGADVAAGQREPAPTEKPMSRIVHVTEEGFPVFENEEDNRAARKVVSDLYKGIPGGIVRGLRDIPDAGAQLLTRGLEAAAPAGSDLEKWAKGQREGVEATNRAAEQDYQQNWRVAPDSPDVGRFAGNAVGAAPLGAAVPGATAAGLLPRMAAGAVAGAGAGALQPVEAKPAEGGGDDFWEKKGLQTAVGAGGGAAAPAILGGLARIVSPNTRPEVATLMNAGVTPTPGQILGGVSSRLEEAAQSIPFVGDAIKAARGRAVNDLNRAAINRALEPIGERLHPDTPLGREAIAEMHERISDNYNRLVPQLRVQADQQFVRNGLGQVMQQRARMSDPAQAQLDRILQNDVFNKFDANGRMTGEAFKTAESELGRQARSFSNSPVASERQIGEAFTTLRGHMRDMLERSNPDRAAELRAANEAFANALRVEGAAAKSGTDQGIFTPAHLLQSVRQLDPSMRKGAYARGDALMQDLGDAGKNVLGNKVPDSGTPLRSAVMAAPALGGIYALNPMAAGGVAAGGAGLVGAYSRPGINTLARLLAQRGPLAEPIAGLLRNPAGATLPAILAAQDSRQ